MRVGCTSTLTQYLIVSYLIFSRRANVLDRQISLCGVCLTPHAASVAVGERESRKAPPTARSMQVAGVRDTVTKFTATVTLTLDLGAPTSASVSESTSRVPDALTATCSGNCKLGTLLDAVVAAIKETIGWQTGTETAESWNDKVALLLAGCPYEEEFEKMIRDALAAGQSITLERRNVKRTKHLTVKGVLLNGKVMTETSEWSDPGDAIVKIDRVECDGRPLKKKKAEVEQHGQTVAFLCHILMPGPPGKHALRAWAAPGILQVSLGAPQPLRASDSMQCQRMVRPSARAKVADLTAVGPLGADLHRGRLVYGAWVHQAARQWAEVYDVLRPVVSLWSE